MQTVLVRYKIQDDKVAENEALIHGVFDELRASPPPGLSYATFKLDDGSSFVHMAMIDTADGSNPLLGLDSFKRFLQDLRDRCAEPPAVTDLFALDGYGFIGPNPGAGRA